MGLKFCRVWFVTCRQVEEDAAKGPDVGFETAGQLLKGFGGSEALGGALSLASSDPLLLDHELDRNTKIDELQLIVFPGQHDIVRLQIFVHNLVRVNVPKSSQKLPSYILQFQNGAGAEFLLFHITCQGSPINFFDYRVELIDSSSRVVVAREIVIFDKVGVFQVFNNRELKNSRNHFLCGLDLIVQHLRIFVSVNAWHLLESTLIYVGLTTLPQALLRDEDTQSFIVLHIFTIQNYWFANLQTRVYHDVLHAKLLPLELLQIEM